MGCSGKMIVSSPEFCLPPASEFNEESICCLYAVILMQAPSTRSQRFIFFQYNREREKIGDNSFHN